MTSRRQVATIKLYKAYIPQGDGKNEAIGNVAPHRAYNRTGYCQRVGHSLGDPVPNPARLAFAYSAGRLCDAPILCGIRAGHAKGCMQLFSPSFLGEERPAAVLLHFIQRHLSAVQRGDLYCRPRQLQGAGTGRHCRFGRVRI